MSRDYPEGHDRVLAKEPCPRCGSKDNLVRYADQHASCFTPGCGYWERAAGDAAPAKERRPVSANLIKPSEAIPYTAQGFRATSPKTRQTLGVFQASYGSKTRETVQVYPIYANGKLVGQKLRTAAKEFPVLKAEDMPPLAECDLFGRHFYGDRFDRRVIIMEGEEDAIAGAQVVDFKTAVVSLTAGASAARRNLQANWQWLDRFNDIVLMFDNDEAGQKAVAECQDLFAIGKLRTARMPTFKDASEALQKKDPGAVETAIYSATTYRPRGIVNAADCRADISGTKISKKGWDYPWACLNAKTWGIRPGEVVYHVSGTGMGKTSGFYEISKKLVDQGVKVGHLHFEDTRADVQLGIMSIHANRRLGLNPLDPAEMEALHAKVFGERKVELFDPEAAEWAIDAIMGYVRYMAKALDCKVIFIDPISFIAAGLDLNEDERRALDKASRDVAALTKELQVSLHVSHHLARPKDGPAHEEGAPISLNQVRGSGGIANFASIVLAWEGDLQGPAPNLRRLRILKNRPIGAQHAGLSGVLSYDDSTGRYTEFDGEYPDRHANKGRGRGREGGFGRPPDDFSNGY